MMKRNSISFKTQILGAFAAVCVLFFAGCDSIGGKKDVERGQLDQKKEYSQPKFVGDITMAYGAEPIEVSAVSLAANLAGTGSDPPESVQRTMLLREMASRDVAHPAKVLADPSTSLVIVSGHLPPGVQKGDRFDVEVTVTMDSETTSLRGGYLLPAPMKEMQMLDRLREGRKRATCSGPIIVEPKTGTPRDKMTQCRGIVLGGGVSTISRQIHLLVSRTSARPDKFMTMKIERAINARFKMGSGSSDKVAKAKDDKMIYLSIPPEYRQNIYRFVEVVQCIPILEMEAERLDRMNLLEKRLMDPTSAKRAALELEAIGRKGIDTLKLGLTSNELYVQFHAAQALAYLDVSDGAEVLGRVALEDRVNRDQALKALSALDDLNAYDVLRDLMSSETAETRYGAFRALYMMRPTDPLVAGELLGRKTFHFCVIPSTGKPMLHVTKRTRAEITVFGEDQHFRHPLVVEAPNNIIVRSNSDDEIVVSRFGVNQQDQRRTVSSRVEDVIRALSEVGATYPDVLEVIQGAIEQKSLSTSFHVDALPESGRLDPIEKNRIEQERRERYLLSKAKREARAENGEAEDLDAENADSSEDSVNGETDDAEDSTAENTAEGNGPAADPFSSSVGDADAGVLSGEVDSWSKTGSSAGGMDAEYAEEAETVSSGDADENEIFEEDPQTSGEFAPSSDL